MNISFLYKLLQTAKITAILSFLGGTFLLILYFYFSGSKTILSLGIYYTLFTLMLNSILFFTLIITFMNSEIKRKKILTSLFIMIINIPIGCCYVAAILSYPI
ncbi:hypothetical protein [uncultured Kordia sp.]|uniref:hypothetical protein n=1 Tax=uncultured Kordia sp. TaxID=507699 RepID=UPI00262A3D1C|nr:hypothetical protein [uncultured Kordia sp.]